MRKIVILLLLIQIISQKTHTQNISLREKIGQLLVVGYSGKFLNSSIIDDLKNKNLGGVILFSSNIINPTQLKSITDSIKLVSKTYPFIAIDQEGGKVARLNNTNGYEITYSAYKLGTIINNEDTTRFYAGKMAEWLKNGGINLNLAPVVDVNINPQSPAIGKNERSFSQNPDSVFLHASWFISEMNKRNILTTLKHFPGHGSAQQDSHLGFTDISNTWTEKELIPFSKLIEKNYNDFIMSGHLYNSQLDTLYHASLSKLNLTYLLRNNIGFKGIIITDELFMQAITKNYSFEESIELAINSGNDILLFSTNIYNNKSLVDEVIKIIETKITEGKISLSRIEEAYNRITFIKKRFTLSSICQNNFGKETPEIKLFNYPNPFNSSTNIIFNVPKLNENLTSHVILKVFDVLGKEVVTLIDEKLTEGTYNIKFSGVINGKPLSSGSYFCILKVDDKIESKKIFLLK